MAWLDSAAQARATRAYRARVRDCPRTEAPIRPGGASEDVRSKGGYCSRLNVLDYARCDGGHVWARWRPCRLLSCVACREVVARRRAARRYEQMGGKGFLIIVITWPGSWRHVAGPEHLLAWRAGQRIILRGWLESHTRTAVGGAEYWHPAGEHKAGNALETGPDDPARDEPMECHPHLNYLIPLAGLGQSGPCSLAFKGSRPGWVPMAAIDELRSLLDAELSTLAQAWGLPEARANVFIEYRKGRKKTLHAAKYFCRPWPQWADTMRKLGTGTLIWALHPGFARTAPDEQRALFAYIRAPEQEEKVHECPECGRVMDIFTGGMGLHPDMITSGGARGPPAEIEGKPYIRVTAGTDLGRLQHAT